MPYDKEKAHAGQGEGKDTRKVKPMSRFQNTSPAGDDLRNDGQHIVTANDAVEANAGKLTHATLHRYIQTGQIGTSKHSAPPTSDCTTRNRDESTADSGLSEI